MRPEIIDLIEAVRALGVIRTGGNGTRSVRITGPTTDFAERLAFLQEKLEAVDASGALASDEGPAPPKPEDVERHRKALDGLLRFIQVRGLDMDAATEIVAAALEVGDAVARKEKAYETLPRFAPKGWKKRKRLKPTLNLMPDRPGDASLNDLRAIAFGAEMTTNWMGAAFAKESKRLSEELDALSNVTVPPPPTPSA